MHLSAMGIEYNKGSIRVLDQSLLPYEERWIESNTVEDMCGIIKDFKVEGASLIGIAAAFALAQQAEQGASIESLETAGEALIRSRPTAVNLKHCVERVFAAVIRALDPKTAITVAEEIFEEDVALCKQISKHGAELLPANAVVMTCGNTGALATAWEGTALGVIKEAHRQGKIRLVYVNETRPLLQGARLTALELRKASIPFKLICDNMAGQILRDKGVTAVIVGADRIVLNGDVANKIGTYSLACLAKMHQVPFYVAGPNTTLDSRCQSGRDIVIEQRAPNEVKGALGNLWAPDEVEVENPAFDVTPEEFITCYILDTGNWYFHQLFAQGSDRPRAPSWPSTSSDDSPKTRSRAASVFLEPGPEDEDPLLSQPRNLSGSPIVGAGAYARVRQESPRVISKASSENSQEFPSVESDVLETNTRQRKLR